MRSTGNSDRMGSLELTKGTIALAMQGEESPSHPLLQILSFKKIAGQGAQDRFRLHISDGEYSHSFAMLATQLNDMVHSNEIEPFAVIRANKIVNNTMNNKKIMIILQLDVVAKGSEVGTKLGNPVPWGDSVPRAPVNRVGPPSNGYSDTNSAAEVKPYTNGSTGSSASAKVDMNGSGGGGGRLNLYDSPSAQKKPKTENIDFNPAAVVPIQDINPYNKVTIRARVTNKGDVKTWSNSRGEGKLFSMDLLDDSGEIRMTGFNNAVDTFYDMIEVNHVYYITRFTVKPANKQFTSIAHDYEISFSNDTQVVPCVEDTSDIPQVTFNFVSIADIENVAADKIIDVIGVCKSFGDCQSLTARSTGKEFKKRELTLVDQSAREINLTLWGKTAEDFCDDTQPIIAAKGVKVSDYGGKSLSCLQSSLFQINPDLPEAHSLRGWFDSEGVNLASQSLSSTNRGGGAAPWKLAIEANEVTSSDMEKTDVFMCKVTLMAIKGDNAVYKACTTEKCNKKVVDLGNGMYKCEKCGKEQPAYKSRLMLSCHFADFTDHFWATCFHETSEAILGEKGDVLGDLYDNRREEFDQVIKNALFQQYVGKFRSKMENYNNEIRKKITVLDLNIISHGEYAKQLLNEIRECSS